MPKQEKPHGFKSPRRKMKESKTAWYRAAPNKVWIHYSNIIKAKRLALEKKSGYLKKMIYTGRLQ